MQFSKSAQKLRASEIRELMKLAADPNIISFAGGMPNNDLFPVKAIEDLYANLSDESKKAAFQYGPTNGYPPLRASLRDYLESKGLPVEGNEILITTGAQQAINLLTKVFIDEGDRIVCEYPSFIGSLAAFKSYEAELVGIELDDEGINMKKLEEKLEKGPKPKFLYLIPNFQNPAGSLYSLERKQEIIDLIRKYDIPLLEDDPYGELWFDKKDAVLTTPIKTLMQDTKQVLYVGSFAKILGPGFRLGFMLVPTEVYDKCELAKQSQDACSSTYTQVLADAYLRNDALTPYLNYLRPIYKRRAELMLAALEKYMPKDKGISWTTPRGGFFVWVTLPENINVSDIFPIALAKGAAFVVGHTFDPEGKKNNCMRLAFSHTPEEKITAGVKMVAEAVAEMMG